MYVQRLHQEKSLSTAVTSFTIMKSLVYKKAATTITPSIYLYSEGFIDNFTITLIMQSQIKIVNVYSDLHDMVLS